jgi:hypothetical protein
VGTALPYKICIRFKEVAEMVYPWKEMSNQRTISVDIYYTDVCNLWPFSIKTPDFKLSALIVTKIFVVPDMYVFTAVWEESAPERP